MVGYFPNVEFTWGKRDWEVIMSNLHGGNKIMHHNVEFTGGNKIMRFWELFRECEIIMGFVVGNFPNVEFTWEQDYVLFRTISRV